MPAFVKLHDDITKKLLELEKSSPGIIDKIAIEISEKFKERTRDNYMSGQILGERTGKAKRSLWARYKHKGSLEFKVPPLANIYEAYTDKFGRRPFWSQSWKDFVASRYADRIAREIMEKELEKIAK